MRVRVHSDAVAEALAGLGDATAEPEDGLIFAPRPGLETWSEVEEELVEAFRLSQRAMAGDAPVIYVLRADAVLGRAPVLDSAAADALVGGARALAFEGKRKQRYATVIGLDAEENAESLGRLRAAVEFATVTRAASGQIVMLGDEHLGAMLP